MEFIVSSSSLLSALQSAGKVIASKNTLPILDSFLFNLEEGKLTITASDLEARLVTSLDIVYAEGTGLFAIDAKRLIDPLKELAEQPLTIHINDANMAVTVNYQNGKFNLPGQLGDAYPQQRPLNENATTITLSSQLLLNGITRSMFAMAEDELRPIMNGIFFDLKPENLTFVASDGHKLVRLRNSSVQSSFQTSFILPRKPANLLKNLLPKAAEEITVAFDENNAYVKTASFEMICRLIEGKYPNYNAVIPVDNPNIAILDRISFLSAVKRVSTSASQSSGLIRVKMAENELTIFAQDIDFSTSAEEQVVCQYSSIPFEIGFKASCLIDILSNISAESVALQMADPAHSCVVVPTENEENEDLLMLLVPLRLND